MAAAPPYPSELAEWKAWTEPNVRALYRRVDELKARKRIIQKGLCRELGFNDTEFSKWKNQNSADWTEIGEGRFHKTLVWLNHRGYLFDRPSGNLESLDEVYDGVSRFLRVTKQSFELSARFVTGTYIVFRYSNFLGGDYVLRGYMNIDYVSELEVIKTTEHFRIQKEVSETEKVYVREGYLFYRDAAPIIISRKKYSSDIQIIYLKALSPIPSIEHDKRVENMEGALFAWQESEIYSTQIAFVRDDDAKIYDREFVKAIEPSELKSDVKTMLSKGIMRVGEHITRYT